MNQLKDVLEAKSYREHQARTGLVVHNNERKQAAKDFAESLRPDIEACIQAGLGLRAIAETLNSKGLTTVSGNPWNLGTVAVLLGRLGLKTANSN